ncbi:MAG: tryptophan synthase subunit alpha [candidate division FCPU426 bacterium]
MSRRLQQRLAAELGAGRRLFVPFITAGDRGFDFTRQAVLRLAGLGADAVELGVPFSDPLADGPVIQASSQRALEAGATLPKIFDLARSLRRQTNVPLLLMGYYNPFLQFGLEASARQAVSSGVDGCIIPDLPPEEAGPWISQCRLRGLDTVFMTTPNSPETRVQAVARSSSGYIYYMSVTGTTGARRTVPPDLAAGLKRVRRHTRLPILVGFGISSPQQASQVSRIAEGVIVGSALVKAMEGRISDAQALNQLSKLASGICRAVKKPIK